MAYTRQDLITLVLQNVGVLAAGQEASIEDRAAVNLRIGPKLAELAKREIIVGLEADALDDAVFLHVADIIAFACRVPLGITGSKAEVLTAAAVDAEASLKALSRQYSTTAATGAFDVVRHVLEALGVVNVGQDPSAQDRGVVMARVAPMLADLRLREIANIVSLETANPGTQLHLSVILTSACAQAFGKDKDTRALLAAEAMRAESLLKALARQLDTGVAVSGVFDPIQVALEHLGIVSAGQTASVADRAVIESRVQPKLMELRGRDICGVTDLSQLTADLQGAFARILAAECAASFAEVPADRAMMLKADVAEQERILRYQSFIYDARRPMRIERFWGRRGGAGWCG